VIAQINSSWTVRVNRDELVEFQVDGTLGSAVVGLFDCKIQPRTSTPKPVWNPDIEDEIDYAKNWLNVPSNEPVENGFKTQWCHFIRHVVEDAPYSYDLYSGAKGLLLAEKALESSREARRVDIPNMSELTDRR
jgi:predicted dehydrogenase